MTGWKPVPRLPLPGNLFTPDMQPSIANPTCPNAERVYSRPMSVSQKILVVQPSWVGDAVMATPTLRALRELYPSSQISYLMRRYVKPLYAGMPWADQFITYRTGKEPSKTGRGLFDLAA